MAVITAYVTEDEVTTAASVLPVVTGVTATAGTSSVTFEWMLTTTILPYSWEIRTKVDGGAWDNDWALFEGKTILNTFTRHLTLAERASSSTANIEIDVRSIDGSNNVTAEASADANCLGWYSQNGEFSSGVIATGDIANGTILTGDIASGTILTGNIATGAITSTNILNATILTGDIASGAIEEGNMANNSVNSAQIVAGSVDLVHMSAESVDSAQYVDGSIDNVHLAGNIAVTKFASDATNRMFGTNGVAALDAVLPVTVNSLNSGDDILMIGSTNGNIYANRAAIKHATTGLVLSNVENKTGATIMADELDNDALEATTQAVVDGSAETVDYTASKRIIGAINASTETANIATAQLDVITDAAKLVINGQQTIDSSGRIIADIRDDIGNITLTAQNLTSAINTAGQCINFLLPGATISGTLNDIPQTGTNKTVTADEKTGAGYAFTGLNVAGENTIGINDGASISAASIGARVTGRRVVWAEDNTGAPVTDFAEHTAGPGAADRDTHVIQYLKCDSDGALYFKCLAKDTANDGVIEIELKTAAGAPIGGGLTGDVLIDGSGGAYVEKECSLTVPATANATMYQVWINVESVTGTCTMKGGILSVGIA